MIKIEIITFYVRIANIKINFKYLKIQYLITINAQNVKSVHVLRINRFYKTVYVSVPNALVKRF